MAAQSARTQYVQGANGVRFAYRRLGKDEGIPLAMHMHFRANMDHWDPLLLNSLAKARPVIIFDSAGVGRSSGEVSETFQGWADDMIAFLKALNIQKADILGFSQGGMAVQMVALTVPKLVRNLILAGTMASAPSASEVPGVVWPRDMPPPGPLAVLCNSATPEEDRRALEYSFFPDDDHGRAAFASYWNRVRTRHAEPLMLDLLDRNVGGARQSTARGRFMKPDPHNSFDRLKELQMPVFIANGDHDVLIPSSRSWELLTQIDKAHLIIYPHAGHGFIWQYAETYAAHINTVLGPSEFEKALDHL